MIKLGGGMLAYANSFEAALAAIADVSRHRRVLIVPGGGPFADIVREMDRRLGLSDDAAHWMAVLAMDQYAHLIAGKLEDAVLVDDVEGIGLALANGRIPVLISTPWLRRADPLPHSWAVTGDSIAAWVAGQLGARNLVLVKPPGAARVPEAESEVDAYFHRAVPPGIRTLIVSADKIETLGAAISAGDE